MIKKNSLPAEYQRVEWIQGAGNNTTYITTNIYPNSDMRFYFKGILNNTGYAGRPFGAYNTNSSSTWWGLGKTYSPEGVVVAVLGTNTQYNTNFDGSILHTIETTDDNMFLLDGVNVGSINQPASKITASNKLTLFYRNGLDNYYSNARIYEIKIKENGNLIAKFVPCYRKSDSEIGIYDTVSDIFYANEGTGTFTKGSNILDDVEFIYKNGQNIDKVYKGRDLVFEQGFTREQQGIPPIATTYQTIGKNLKNYKIYGNSIQRNIPEEYQEVEWIAGDDSGNPMIEVGEVSSLNTRVEFNAKLKRINEGSGYPAFLSTLDYANTQLLINQHPQVGTEAFFYVTFGNIVDRNGAIYNGFQPTQNFYDYVLDKNGLNIPNYGSIDFNATTFSSATICILGKANNNSKSDAYFRYFKVYDGDTLLYDLVPSYRKADNVIGMYDVVTNRFLTNSRTGSLTKGADIIPSWTNPIEIRSVGNSRLPQEYQEVEYIENSSNGTIPVTPVDIRTTDEIHITIMRTGQSTNYDTFFGSRISEWYTDSTGAFKTYYSANYTSITPNDTIAELNKKYDIVGYTSTAITLGVGILSYYDNASGFSYNFIGRVYKCKVIRDGSAVYEWIPCYRKADNAIGMYDIANNVFYAGTGTLTKGQDIYAIPVIASDGTSSTKTNIYLTAPLRRVSDGVVEHTDYIDFENQKVVRNCTELIITGYETNWEKMSGGLFRFKISVEQVGPGAQSTFPDQLCNYAECKVVTVSGGEIGASVYYSPSLNGSYFRIRPNTSYSSVTSFTNKVKQMYNDGNPLRIVFFISTPVEEQIQLPDIPSIKGTTIYSVDTTVQPSNMYIKYKGK